LAVEIDLGAAMILVDHRAQYGEVRYLAFDRIHGRGHCFVFTFRNGVVRDQPAARP
jgi:uncharacterized DUF497 family protein